MPNPKCPFHLSILASCCLSLGINAAEDDPLSREALFGDDLPQLSSPSSTDKTGSGIRGFMQFEAADTVASPEHWSKLRARTDLSDSGNLGNGVKWKMGARFDYDFAYAINNFYPPDVEKNQRRDIELRENYIDYGLGDWDFRVGRQHVIWGEMVGLFFADVVSARDLREFVLPDFDQMRIPQWAARAEYFTGDYHAELLWIPVASYDNIGKPGAAFYPMPTGPNIRYLQEERPQRNADNMNYGLRLSTLKNGWDVSAFAYRSSDVSPTFYRQFDGPTVVYQARHDRINQYGSTLSKDFGDVVLKAEGVYTTGRSFSVQDPNVSDGVVRQNTLDWAVGLDFTLPAESRFNVQLFQRRYSNYNPTQIPDREENGYSLLFNTKFIDNWEAQTIFIASLNRTDWLLRPRLTWNFERNWRLLFGADIFKGPPTGLFGRYDQQNRIYSEIRYSF